MNQETSIKRAKSSNAGSRRNKNKELTNLTAGASSKRILQMSKIQSEISQIKFMENRKNGGVNKAEAYFTNMDQSLRRKITNDLTEPLSEEYQDGISSKPSQMASDRRPTT